LPMEIEIDMYGPGVSQSPTLLKNVLIASSAISDVISSSEDYKCGEWRLLLNILRRRTTTIRRVDIAGLKVVSSDDECFNSILFIILVLYHSWGQVVSLEKPKWLVESDGIATSETNDDDAAISAAEWINIFLASARNVQANTKRWGTRIHR
jgi:hypothetical protein